MLSDIVTPPLPELPCCLYDDDYQPSGIPLSLIQVAPLSFPADNTPSSSAAGATLTEARRSQLSSPIVKIYLQDICEDHSSTRLRIQWDDDSGCCNRDDIHRRRSSSGINVVSGCISTRIGCQALRRKPKQWRKESIGNENDMWLPIVMIPSPDPTNSDGVPCVVRGFSMPHIVPKDMIGPCEDESHTARYFLNDTVRITNGTLVQILPNVTCDWIDKEQQICRIRTRIVPQWNSLVRDLLWAEKDVSLIHELSGISSVHLDYDDEDFLLGYEPETVRALTIRMKILLQRQILIGTTANAVKHHHNGISRRHRMGNALDSYLKRRGIDAISNRGDETNHQVVVDTFSCDGALTVHDPSHGSGKTTLVATIASRVLKCQAVHILNASTLFAKYGASETDAALESLLHAIVVSAAVKGVNMNGTGQVGSICIILDHLECFVPPSMSGAYHDGGDPAIPALNSIRAYLSKLTNTIQNHNTFPYPTKNHLYNIRGDDDGYVFPIRICLVGVVTIDDDGGRKGAALASSTQTVLSVLGDNRYRLPTPSLEGYYEICMQLFKKYGIELCAEAKNELPFLISSLPNPKAVRFVNIVKTLHSLLQAETYDNQSRPVATLDQVKISFGTVSHDDQPAMHSEKLTSKRELFSAIGGNNEAKKALVDALAFDERHVLILKKFGMKPPCGVLLYGPPGTGKTLLAKAIASMMQSDHLSSTTNSQHQQGRRGIFLSLSASDIVRSEVGKSEKIVFSAFQAARDNAPSVIFIDEFQALFTSRDGSSDGSGKGNGRLASTLLQCMDDISKWREADYAVAKDMSSQNIPYENNRVVVFGATNTPWMVDRAFLRAGRFDRVVYVGLPDQSDRESILRVHVSRMKIHQNTSIKEVCSYLAAETSGFSGADLAALIRAAAVRCLNDTTSDVRNGVELRHFRDARKFDMVGPTSNAKLVQRLLRWRP